MQLTTRYEGIGRIVAREAKAEDPGPGQVRVRVERCGICGSDLHCFRGHAPQPAACPGHEMSGVVEALGRGVTAVREGDRVAVEPALRCGTCSACRSGDYHLCARLALCGVTAPGGMASSLVVPDYTLFPLPASVDFALGALAEPVAVAMHAARLGGVREGSRVLVLGTGTIGLAAVCAARHLGAAHVAVTARHPQQRELAAQLGADLVLDPDEAGDARIGGQRPDVAIETVGGRAPTVGDGVRAVARAGTVVMVGLFEETPAFDPGLLLAKEVRLVGSMIYNRPAGARADFELALDCLAARSESLRALVTHTFALHDVQRAFDTAADKASGAVKVMLAPGTA